MNHSDDIKDLAAALVAAQADMTNPPLDGVNPHFKSKFTTLATMIEHTRPILAKHGLAVIQHPVGDTSTIGIETILVHASGQWLSQSYDMPSKPDPQSAGSVITYFRRYALASITGVQGDEDTDAEQAMDRRPKREDAPTSVPLNRPLSKDDIPPASDAQVKKLFALGHKLGIKDGVEDAVHAIKERYGLIPKQWASQQIERLVKQEEALEAAPPSVAEIADMFDAEDVPF